MVLKKSIKLHKSKDANTQYLVIPASVVNDSQYPFKNKKILELEVNLEKGTVTLECVKSKKGD